MTVKEFRRLFSKQKEKAAKRSNKYGALCTGGYASRAEERRAKELQLLEKAGEISDLREQVKYVLIPEVRDSRGKIVERSCSYIADFVYCDRMGNIVVEDVKGVRTKEYIIKRKLMLQVHGIKIREV